jgi:hypothetical protein
VACRSAVRVDLQKSLAAIGLQAYMVGHLVRCPCCVLLQCGAITKDYNAAREAEVERLLQDLAQRRAAAKQAHKLWLASR